MSIATQPYNRRRLLLSALAAAGGLAATPAIARAATLSRLTVSPTQRVATADAALHRALRSFGFHLYRQVAAAQPSANLVLSPLSVSALLALLENGAAGATREAIATTLELTSLSLDSVNATLLRLMEALPRLDTAIKVSSANAIWTGTRYPVAPQFVKTATQSYHAVAQTLDFASPSAAPTINGWVRRQTAGLIDHLVSAPTDPHTVLLAVNALYFKGPWAQPFNHALTQSRPFTRADGSTAAVPMMTQSGGYPYYHGPTYDLAALPYGAGTWSMEVVLPHRIADLPSLEAALSEHTWSTWSGQLQPTYGTITLPRFTVHDTRLLNAALSALGMATAFGAAADFSGLTPVRARLSFVQQAATIAVDEQGTTAAAATAGGIVATAVRTPGFTLVLDRPFLLAIRERVTGTILFLGRIADPTAG